MSTWALAHTQSRTHTYTSCYALGPSLALAQTWWTHIFWNPKVSFGNCALYLLNDQNQCLPWNICVVKRPQNIKPLVIDCSERIPIQFSTTWKPLHLVRKSLAGFYGRAPFLSVFFNRGKFETFLSFGGLLYILMIDPVPFIRRWDTVHLPWWIDPSSKFYEPPAHMFMDVYRRIQTVQMT